MGVDDAEMAEWLAAESLDKRTVVAALSSPFDHERRLMLERLISAESLDPIVQQRIEQLTDDENAAIRAAAFALLEGVPNK